MGGITGNRYAIGLVLFAMVALLGVPALHNDYITLTFRNILMFAAMSYGWNMIGGYTGYVSFGNVVFFGMGAYCSAVLAVADLVNNLDVLGGSSGLVLKQADQAHFWIYYYAMWLVAIGCILGTYAIARSKLGYAFVAIRENEDAAQVLGISPTRYKVTAWALGAMMAGAAGAVYAPANGFIDPSITFAIDNNVFPIVMAILGGMGTVAGPFIGALLLAGINEFLQQKFLQAHTIFFGATIVLVVVFLPRGLMYLVGLRGGVRRWFADLRVFRV